MWLDDDRLHLLTAGRDFSTWKSIHVRRSMASCSGDFALGVAWGRKEHDAMRRIAAGEECEVKLGERSVMRGFVDVVEVAVDDRQHEIAVTGRDRTADLVDCSAVAKSGQWKGAKIEQIAADLAAPFGVGVIAEVNTGAALPSFALQAGETVFEAIERAARVRALLLMADASGNLVITRAGNRRAATRLVLGENLLSLRIKKDMRDRYSRYTVMGQAPGSDLVNGPRVSQMKASATDSEVQRYRPLVLVNDQPDLGGALRDRVRWEASVRASRAIDITATVPGWTYAAGQLWDTNTLVRVDAPQLLLEADLLIYQVEFKLDDQGQTTTLLMTRPDAYSVLPMAAANAGPWWYTGASAVGAN
jgi:prophage tail gpP-like protein